MPAVYLVRHGQAGTSLDDYDRLSEIGVQQAAATGRALRARGLSAPTVVSGAMVRQSQTAGHLVSAAGWDTEVGVDAGWDEYDHRHVLQHYATGDVTALLAARVGDATEQMDEAVRAWWADPGSTWPEFGRRVDAALAAVLERLESGSAAVVVTSGGVIAHLCARLLGAADDTRFVLGQVVVNGSVTVLSHGRSRTRVVAFNEHAHLLSPDGAGRRDLLTSP